MQLRAATKQTNPNFVRVIRQKFQSSARLGSGCHKPFYRHMFVLSYMYFTFWNFRHRLVRLYWYKQHVFHICKHIQTKKILVWTHNNWLELPTLFVPGHVKRSSLGSKHGESQAVSASKQSSINVFVLICFICLEKMMEHHLKMPQSVYRNITFTLCFTVRWLSKELENIYCEASVKQFQSYCILSSNSHRAWLATQHRCLAHPAGGTRATQQRSLQGETEIRTHLTSKNPDMLLALSLGTTLGKRIRGQNTFEYLLDIRIWKSIRHTTTSRLLKTHRFGVSWSRFIGIPKLP